MSISTRQSSQITGPARLGAYRTHRTRATLPGETVYLDGNVLADPAARGEARNFCWTLLRRPEGSRAQVAQSNHCRASLTPDLPGRYIIRLEAQTPQGRIRLNKEVRVSQDELTPVAVARAESSMVLAGAPIRLNGASSENPLAGPLTYEWRITAAPEGSIAMLSYAASEAPMIFPDREGRYEVSLVVRNAAGQGTTDRVSIKVVSPESLNDLTRVTRGDSPAALNFGRTYSQKEISALRREIHVSAPPTEAVNVAKEPTPAPRSREPQRFSSLIGHIRLLMRDGVESLARPAESGREYQQAAVSRR